MKIDPALTGLLPDTHAAHQRIGVSHGLDAASFHLACWLMNRIVRHCTLTIISVHPFMTATVGRPGNARFAVSIDHPRVLWRVLRSIDPCAGEAYMDGQWRMEDGDIGAFLTALAKDLAALHRNPVSRIIMRALQTRRARRSHDEASCRQYIHHHYDIGDDLYETFLDEGMNYTCAFFDEPGMTLREAQLNKIRTVMKRLGIRPGMRVLDMGCGWGEASRIVAREIENTRVTGVTISENQAAHAQAMGRQDSNPATFHLQDYREHAASHPACYDRIFSIGMLEHVGPELYETCFAAIRQQLAPGGQALVHAIMSTNDTFGIHVKSPWLERYIFPGGAIPNLTRVLDAASQAGLKPVCAPYLQPPSDYAETLRHWRANFIRNVSKLDSDKYDARFRRMWIYYLAMSEAMFDGCGFRIGQVVFEAA